MSHYLQLTSFTNPAFSFFDAIFESKFKDADNLRSQNVQNVTSIVLLALSSSVLFMLALRAMLAFNDLKASIALCVLNSTTT